jgi:GntR family transcriptional repressor for pyruvate dehydrogenase complex
MTGTTEPAAVAPERDETPAFPTVARTSIGLQAAAAIKEMIVSGQLRPGDALPPERDLAVMLGISRPSLREAIRALSAMKVVEARHGGGTFVTSLDPSLLAQPISFLLQVNPNAFEHLLEVRMVLEVGAARIAAGKITDAQLAELQRLADNAARALGRPERYLAFDFELHTKIVEAAANPIYLSLYASIAELSIESRRRTARIPAVRRRAHHDHRTIVEALTRRDADAAAEAMSRHLQGIAEIAGRHAQDGEAALRFDTEPPRER